jgi:predicted GH43/DUF377 family glycosyl hydrolase
VVKPFLAHPAGAESQEERIRRIVDRVRRIPRKEVLLALELLEKRFSSRHRHLDEIWEQHLKNVTEIVPEIAEITDEATRQILGASFTHEYSIEAAALTNPSIVSVGGQEFVLSLRAIGEGHISSIEFRRGRISSDGTVTVEHPTHFARAGHRKEILHQRRTFASKLAEMDAEDQVADMVLDLLPEEFGYAEMAAAVAKVSSRDRVHRLQADTTFHLFHWLATSNYELVFNGEELSERVLFPAGPADSRGMEDARFVRFVEDDGDVTYYATYTAFDGYRILPQMIATADFNRFRVSTLHGACAQNKGMALFPRQVNGNYLALGRHDQINLHLLWSDDVWQWNNAQRLATPVELWEAIQIGNCGSPLETKEGWLVITHGVGPMRTYSLGALLLDLEDPDRVIGRLHRPLLEPNWEDRDGYVPNVVYSCGAMIHDDTLVLPYGIADREVGIGLVDVDELLGAMA